MNNIYDQYVDKYDAGYDDQNRRECVSAKWGRDCPSTVSLPGPLTLTTWSPGLIIVMGNPITIMIITIIIIINLFLRIVIIKDIPQMSQNEQWYKRGGCFWRWWRWGGGCLKYRGVSKSWQVFSGHLGLYSIVLPGHFDSVKFCTKIYSSTKWWLYS